MMRSSISNGAQRNLLFLLLYVKMVDLSYGILFTIKGFGEEEYVRPYLHRQR